MASLRIATFNLENLDDRPDLDPPLEARIAVLRPQLLRLKADILCLQEVDGQPHDVKRAPRRPGQSILSGRVLWRVFFVSLLMVMGTFGVFTWATERGLPVETARTMVVNAIVAMEIFYLFSVRYVHGTSLTWRGVMGTRAVLIGVTGITAAQFAFTYVPFLQRVFGSAPVAFTDGLVIVGIGIALLFIVEIEKRVARRLGFVR